MGLLGGVIGGIVGLATAAISSVFGDSSSDRDSGSYRDNVTVIENRGAVEVAKLENEKVRLVKEAQLEIIEAQKQAAFFSEKAKTKGFLAVAQAMVTFQEKMNEIATNRLIIIENSSLPVIKDIEKFYNELSDKIIKDNEIYNTQKLPKLLEMLNQFDKDSGAYKLYFKRIDADIANHTYFIQQQMDSVAKRQDEIIKRLLDNKNLIIQQTGNISESMLQEMIKNKELLVQNADYNVMTLLNDKQTVAKLPASEQLVGIEGKKEN